MIDHRYDNVVCVYYANKKMLLKTISEIFRNNVFDRKTDDSFYSNKKNSELGR